MAKYLVCVSDERHASYEIERAILEKAGAELKLCHCGYRRTVCGCGRRTA